EQLEDADAQGVGEALEEVRLDLVQGTLRLIQWHDESIISGGRKGGSSAPAGSVREVLGHLGGDGLRLIRARAVRGEHGPAVVPEFDDRVDDVTERAVSAVLGRSLEVGAGEPLLAQLLDRGDVDD